ncbi:hypothetical protein JCM5350_007713 [Sporobolomyces pararoseus]
MPSRVFCISSFDPSISSSLRIAFPTALFSLVTAAPTASSSPQSPYRPSSASTAHTDTGQTHNLSLSFSACDASRLSSSRVLPVRLNTSLGYIKIPSAGGRDGLGCISLSRYFTVPSFESTIVPSPYEQSWTHGHNRSTFIYLVSLGSSDLLGPEETRHNNSHVAESSFVRPGLPRQNLYSDFVFVFPFETFTRDPFVERNAPASAEIRSGVAPFRSSFFYWFALPLFGGGIVRSKLVQSGSTRASRIDEEGRCFPVASSLA